MLDVVKRAYLEIRKGLRGRGVVSLVLGGIHFSAEPRYAVLLIGFRIGDYQILWMTSECHTARCEARFSHFWVSAAKKGN